MNRMSTLRPSLVGGLETIDPIRTAVLRGRVLSRDGSPLPGFRVSVLGHPEYGFTASREDGFDMVVNGGGVLTLRIQVE